MSTDKIALVKILLGCGADSAVTMTKGLSAVGVVPPSVPEALKVVKNYIFPSQENTPCRTDELVNALTVLKEKHPEEYEKLYKMIKQKC